MDRCLPPTLADMLRGEGWIIHDIRDLYARDAQFVPDDEWTELAYSRGWCGLTQDINSWKLSNRQLPLFCLSDGNLSRGAKFYWFMAAAKQVHHLGAQYRPGMWMIAAPPRPVRSRY